MIEFANFHRLKTGLDVDPLIRELGARPQLFDQITARQDYEGSAHRYTKSIFLRWCETPTIEAAFTEIPAIDFPAFQVLQSARPLIAQTVSAVGGLKLGRVLITMLNPRRRILPHADEGFYADHYERFHIPLYSAEGNTFTCGRETVEMKAGELWWFDHKRKHALNNPTGMPRLHLVMDVVAPQYRRERD